MSNESEDEIDEPSTPEEQARIDAQMEEHRIAWEAEATQTFGPPDIRTRKNRRYVSRLIRKLSEPAIRNILKALSLRDKPMCCENLRNHDLETEPLEKIIRPFELLGLHFSILTISQDQIIVEIGEGYGRVGSGGRFVLERLESGHFCVMDMAREWIA